MLTYPTYSSLNSTRFAALKELLTAILQSYDSNIDLRRGPVLDLALHSRSLLAAASEQAVIAALNSGSLTYIAANPTLADQDAVNRAMGNYGLIRRAAAKATGTIGIVIQTLTPTVIPQGSVWTISGQTFTADAAYAGRTSQGAVTGPNDRLMAATTGGYVFTIDVTAQTAGSAGNVKSGAAATATSAPSGFVRAYADVDFTGGQDAETNAELASRQQAGGAIRAWSNRPSIEAVIRADTDFAGLQEISVLGMGDPEMIRDQHSIFPISTGNRADVYVKTADTYEIVRVRKTATLISKVGSVGTWQFGLASTDAPGFYDIQKVLLTTDTPSSSGFSISSDTRTTDTSGSGWQPDITSTIESAYTAYQAGTFQFADTVTDATSLTPNVSTKAYDVMIRGMPLVGDLQDFWNDILRRPPLGDILVKAAIPCFTSVSMTLNMATGATVSAASVKSAVAAAINSLGFVGSLAASYISNVVHQLLPDLLSISGLTITGQIREPDGSFVNLSSTSIITVPDNLSLCTTARTTLFLTDADQIAVSVA